jgi:hypothetical protein
MKSAEKKAKVTSPITEKQSLEKTEKMIQEKAAGASKQFRINEINMPAMRVPIIGLTPLQMDALPPSAMADIRNKYIPGYLPPNREAAKIHPIQRFCDSIHNVLNGRPWVTYELTTPFIPPIGPAEPIVFKAKMNPGIPAVAFKSSIVQSCRTLEKIKMTSANQIIFVLGETIPIDFGSIKMLECFVRTDKGMVPKWPAEFDEWTCDICVMWDAGALEATDIINLINRAGSYGVLCGRPGSTKRTNGMFQVSDDIGPELMTPEEVREYIVTSRKAYKGAEWLNAGIWTELERKAIAEATAHKLATAKADAISKAKAKEALKAEVKAAKAEMKEKVSKDK